VTMTTLEEQLHKYLSDAHALEEQALQQLRRAPGAAGDAGLARVFEQHLVETEGHEQAVRARLEAHAEQPSLVKDLLMRAGGLGFLLFAEAMPDTPGKLLAHAYSFEHLEEAAYELLLRVATRAGDAETAAAARRIAAEERTMAERRVAQGGHHGAGLRAAQHHEAPRLGVGPRGRPGGGLEAAGQGGVVHRLGGEPADGAGRGQHLPHVVAGAPRRVGGSPLGHRTSLAATRS